MGDFFVYILKSSVCLASFYLFYRLLLSRETFHRFNRIALIGLIVLSVAVPFIRVVTEEPVVIQRPMLDLENLLQMAQMQTEVAPSGQSFWLSLLFMVYLVGGIFFFIRFLCSTIRICRIIRKGARQQLQDVTLVITREAVSPFSWMGYIVISEKDREESGREILTHEMAHIRARHSIDMLVCSLCVIIQWFNPAVWLLKQELQNIHEFEADESVISHGVDAKKYQLLLIKKAVGSQRFTSMANSFNHSKLKKRITMMLKQKSSPWARLKYLYVLPLTAVAVVAFARPEISRELEKISSVKISEIVPVKEVIVPKKTEPMADVVPDSPVVTPKPVRTEVVMPVPQEIKVVGKQEAASEKKTEEMTETITVQEAMQKQLDDFSEQAESGIQKVKQRVEVSRYLILIDNKVSTYDQIDRISPENIRSFGISPKDKSGEILTKYNATDKQGVISFVTKEGINSGEVKEEVVHVIGHGSMDSVPGSIHIRTRGGQNTEEHPLVILDGVEQTDKEILSKLDPQTIESVSVLKDATAAVKYGDKARDGVIVIVTKDGLLKGLK
ncbi:M56 family metallopeptidase [Parabacteroides sp.]